LQGIDLRQSLGDHQSLADAIETGDGNIAAEKMIAHIRNGYQLQLNAMDKA
jgi:DNA-binding GntR family transcriptional regulator